jgi:hypothetical protein
MNEYVQQAAQSRRWALGVVQPAAAGVLAYSPGAHLAGRALAPFDVQTSLDGIYPDASGHREIAISAAVGLRFLYGLSFDLPEPGIVLAGAPRR